MSAASPFSGREFVRLRCFHLLSCGFFGFARGPLGGFFRPNPLFLGGFALPRGDVFDSFVDLYGEEADDRVFESKRALEALDVRSVVEESEHHVATLLEVLDLVGETALAEIVVDQSDRPKALEDAIETLLKRTDPLVGDLRLDDQGGFVFPHSSSSWTGPARRPDPELPIDR